MNDGKLPGNRVSSREMAVVERHERQQDRAGQQRRHEDRGGPAIGASNGRERSERIGTDAQPGHGPERSVMAVEQHDDETKEQPAEQFADDRLAREHAESQAKKQQGHDPGSAMVPMNRLAQERHTAASGSKKKKSSPSGGSVSPAELPTTASRLTARTPTDQALSRPGESRRTGSTPRPARERRPRARDEVVASIIATTRVRACRSDGRCA